ncbi:hypothetical protein PQR75_41055 [Paraburkholderia fungorum]|uniref:hypothetical protein n=1 Tax=Paraburkholderia fungorum TaxID=134537 RepID=UPI0038BB20FA
MNRIEGVRTVAVQREFLGPARRWIAGAIRQFDECLAVLPLRHYDHVIDELVAEPTIPQSGSL